MTYQGGKKRFKNELVPIFEKAMKDNNIINYTEPFCGSAAIAVNLKCVGTKTCNDINKYLISVFQNMQQKKELPWIYLTQEEYKDIRTKHKNGKVEDDFLTGYAGFLYSFNSLFFHGYSYITKCSNGRERPYFRERYNALNSYIKEEEFYKIVFTSWDYKKMIFENHLIYCDIPYNNTEKYKEGEFDYKEFENWALEMKKHNNIIYLSEYENPNEQVWEEVWSKDTKSAVSLTKKINRNEKLFIMK